MNMHSVTTVRGAAAVLPTNAQVAWKRALANYRSKRAASDALDKPEKTTEEVEAYEESLSAYCDAMDHLIDNVAAPDVAAVVTKLELMKERYQGCEYPDASETAVMDDLRRLATVAPPAGGESLILQLHRRYGAAWEAYNRLDERRSRKDADDHWEQREHYACERAMGELAGESDLVRQLLLRQVPTTVEELAVVAMHLSLLYESQQDLPIGEQQAVEIGIKQVFDYMMGEGWADMERLGRQASNATMFAWNERRYREGIFEDEDGR